MLILLWLAASIVPVYVSRHRTVRDVDMRYRTLVRARFRWNWSPAERVVMPSKATHDDYRPNFRIVAARLAVSFVHVSYRPGQISFCLAFADQSITIAFPPINLNLTLRRVHCAKIDILVSVVSPHLSLCHQRFGSAAISRLLDPNDRSRCTYAAASCR